MEDTIMEWEKSASKFMRAKMIQSYIALIALVLMYLSLVVATGYENRLQVVRIGILVLAFMMCLMAAKVIRKMGKEYEVALKDILKHSYDKKCYGIDEVMSMYGIPEYIDTDKASGYAEVFITSNGVLAGLRYVDKDEAYLLQRQYGQIKKEQNIELLNYTFKKEE